MYGGRAHRLVGITPVSVTPFSMQLEDPVTGEVFWVEGELRQQAGDVYALVKDTPAGATSRERRLQE